MVVRANPLAHAGEHAAFLPAAADAQKGTRRPGSRERTSNQPMPEGRNSIVLDTKGLGTVDTVGVDTTGDGVADTFYPASLRASGDIEVDTGNAEPASPGSPKKNFAPEA